MTPWDWMGLMTFVIAMSWCSAAVFVTTIVPLAVRLCLKAYNEFWIGEYVKTTEKMIQQHQDKISKSIDTFNKKGQDHGV